MVNAKLLSYSYPNGSIQLNWLLSTMMQHCLVLLHTSHEIISARFSLRHWSTKWACNICTVAMMRIIMIVNYEECLGLVAQVATYVQMVVLQSQIRVLHPILHSSYAVNALTNQATNVDTSSRKNSRYPNRTYADSLQYWWRELFYCHLLRYCHRIQTEFVGPVNISNATSTTSQVTFGPLLGIVKFRWGTAMDIHDNTFWSPPPTPHHQRLRPLCIEKNILSQMNSRMSIQM